MSKKDNFVKRNELVSLKGNTLSIYARKTLDYIYKHGIEIYSQNKEKGIFELDIVELKKEIGMNRTSDHTQIIAELTAIQKLEFETFDSKYYSRFPILAGFQIKDNGTLRVALSPFLIEMIFDKEKPYYHIADFMEYKSLKSKYSKIILDLYNRYKPTEIPKMDREEFEERMQYSNKYRNNDIRQYVLEQAQKELEKYNDLILTWEFLPTPRKWTSIKLFIEKKYTEIEEVKEVKTPPITKKNTLGEDDLSKFLKEIEENIKTVVKEEEEYKVITKQECEKLYEEYLKKYNAEDTILMRRTFNMANMKKYKIID